MARLSSRKAPVGRRQPTVELNVLGSFEAVVDGDVVSLGGPLQRAVLARVLVAEDAPVLVEQIVADIWDERATESTATSVHAYVSRLRKVLGEEAIPRRQGGYLVDRAVARVDADLLAEEVGQGKRALARGADREAAAVLENALARWHGPRPFGTLGDLAFLAGEAARLEQLRVSAAEILADAHLRLDRAAEDVTLLDELAAHDPLRETLTVRLMRALYAAGRQADALTAFERCRRALAEQLGVDPAPLLREMHAAVLAQESAPRIATASHPLPVNLPSRNRSFVARERLLAELDRELDREDARPRALALCGLPGAGKTELALEIAHRRHRQGRVAWWISAEDTAGMAAGLADLATALGIPHHQREEETRAALWTELDRTPGWLLVLDNVDDPDRVEPYLPDAVHGDVVITSRNPAWRRFARPLAVPPLTRPEAVTYVLARSGDPDRAAAETLAGLLGDLPLALEQSCAYIEQTGMSVSEYVRLFRDHRAALLLRQDSDHTVATTWGLAFERLRRRSMRAATLLETVAFLAADAIAVDMLAPLAPDPISLQDAVAELLRLSLVDRKAGVVRVHRLVQDVVREWLPADVARERLVTAAHACVAHQAGSGVEGADSATIAAHLMVVATHCLKVGVVPDGLVDAMGIAAGHYAGRALYPAAEQLLRAALALLDLQDEPVDPALRGSVVCRLGEVLDAAGRLSEALELHLDAVDLLSGMVDPAGVERSDKKGTGVVVAHAFNRLGHVLNCADDAIAAIAAHERALAILAAAGREELMAPVYIDLGYTVWSIGGLERAAEVLERGRTLLELQERRESRDWAHATAGLGMVAQDRGLLDEAISYQGTAIEVFTRVCGADHPDTAQALDKLGYALRLAGRAGEAIDAHLRAVRLLERVLGPVDSRVAMTLTNLGLAYSEASRPLDAVEAHTRARAIFTTTLGPAHTNTLLAGRRLAVALARARQPGRAQQLMSEILEPALERAENNDAERARIEAEAETVFAAALAANDSPPGRGGSGSARSSRSARSLQGPT